MFRRAASIALAVALLIPAGTSLAGPSKEEPASSGLSPPPEDTVIVGSCQLGKDVCIDYEGSYPNGEAQVRCKKVKGRWSDDSCTADGRVGTCTVRDVGSDNRVMTRYYKPATEKNARAECKKQPRAVFLVR
jgi:hypothetical protein